jgi:hypothetical protein
MGREATAPLTHRSQVGGSASLSLLNPPYVSLCFCAFVVNFVVSVVSWWLLHQPHVLRQAERHLECIGAVVVGAAGEVAELVDQQAR